MGNVHPEDQLHIKDVAYHTPAEMCSRCDWIRAQRKNISLPQSNMANQWAEGYDEGFKRGVESGRILASAPPAPDGEIDGRAFCSGCGAGPGILCHELCPCAPPSAVPPSKEKL